MLAASAAPLRGRVLFRCNIVSRATSATEASDRRDAGLPQARRGRRHTKMRSALATIILAALGAAGAARAAQPAVFVGRCPDPAGRGIVGGRSDPRRHAARDPRRRSGDVQALRPADPRELAEALATWGRPSATPRIRRGSPRFASSTPCSTERSGSSLQHAGSASPRATRGWRRRRSPGRRRSRASSASASITRLVPDDLEPLPSQPATRAEAAYSFARALKLTPDRSPGSISSARRFPYRTSVTGSGRCWGERSVHRVTGPLGRHIRADAEALERLGARRRGRRPRQAPIAPGSCGGSTRPSRSPVRRRCSETSSRAGRRTR